MCCAVMPAPGPTRRRSRTASCTLDWRSAADARPPRRERAARGRRRAGRPRAVVGAELLPHPGAAARVLRDRGDVLSGELAPAARRARVRHRRPRARRSSCGKRKRSDRRCGPAGRAAGHDAPLDPPRHRGARARGVRGIRRGRQPASIPTRTRPPTRRSCSSTPPRSTAGPNAAMLPSRALIAQGLLMAPWSGIDAAYVFLNSGPLFHIGTFMPNLSTFVMGGTNVFVRRSDGEELCRGDRRGTVSPAGSSSGRWSTRSSPRTPTDAFDLSTFRGKRGNPDVRRVGAAGRPRRGAGGPAATDSPR